MVYTLNGSYSIEQADFLKEELLALLRSGNAHLQLDLSCLQSIDLSCIQVLLAFLKEAHKEKITVSVSKPSQEVLLFFYMCGLLRTDSWENSSDLLDVLHI